MGEEERFAVLVTLTDGHPRVADSPIAVRAASISVGPDGHLHLDGELEDRVILAGAWGSVEVAPLANIPRATAH